MVNELTHAAGADGLYQTMSVREQFADAWWQLRQTGQTSLTVTSNQLPFWARDHQPAIDSIGWYAGYTTAPAGPS